MSKLFEYGGRNSALAEGDRVDALVKVYLCFFARYVQEGEEQFSC